MSTYLLIHVSWHGARCWHKITAQLESVGHKVIVPDMPSHGRDWRTPGQVTMQDYVDVITRILDSAADPVVLVVHSRNGIVAALAAEARPGKIRALVSNVSLREGDLRARGLELGRHALAVRIAECHARALDDETPGWQGIGLNISDLDFDNVASVAA